VGDGDATGDGQAQPAALCFARISACQPCEPLEDPFPVGLRDAGPGVGDFDPDLGGLVGDAHSDVPARRGGVSCVAEEVVQELGDALRVAVRTTIQTSADYQSSRAADLGDLSHIVGLLTALVVLTELMAALSVANTLTLSVTERAREFAVMRALGLTRHQLGAMVRAESVITCLFGALPGAAIGLVAGTALAATLTLDQAGVATIQIPLEQLGAVLALTCLAGLLAAVMPARHTARVPILEATKE
jgi:putative ABC transport system permease protein